MTGMWLTFSPTEFEPVSLEPGTINLCREVTLLLLHGHDIKLPSKYAYAHKFVKLLILVGDLVLLWEIINAEIYPYSNC